MPCDSACYNLTAGQSHRRRRGCQDSRSNRRLHHRRLVMSMFTPTASSSFFAGIGLWSVIWSGVYKIESVAKMFGLGRFVSKEKILGWISGHKVVTLIGTEAINFGVHGVENPNSVTMAIG